MDEDETGRNTPATLFGMGNNPPRKLGAATLAALTTTLKALRVSGVLVGPTHAARRRALRDAALAVDVARHSLEVTPRCDACGKPVKNAYAGSPYTLAMTTRIFHELLTAAGSDSHDHDPYADDHTTDGYDLDAASWLDTSAPGDTTDQSPQ